MSIYVYMWLHMIKFGYIWLYIDYIWLYMIIYGYLWLNMIKYD